MSYNTRRTTTGYGTPQQSANAIGQRRPAQTPTNNFVPGGQLSGSQQQKPPMQQQQQQRPPQQQQQPGGNVRNQAPQGQQQNYPSQSYSTTPTQLRHQQAQPVKQEPAKTPVQQQPKVATPKVATPQNTAPIVPGANPPPPEERDDSMDTSGGGSPFKKRFWPKGGRISNFERTRRRNLRLSKILQPKNAVMILNELVKGCVFNVEDLPVKVDQNQFRGTVTFNGLEFAGTGHTKVAARNAAAETALKHLIKNKEICSTKKEVKNEDGDEKMDIAEEEGNQVMPWSHIASFAVYKLFSTWGEDPNTIGRSGTQENKGGNQNANNAPTTPRPPKKMPSNPETMNPLMLLHQMIPNAVWDEVGQSGSPPNVVFTFSVTIDDKQFTGTGSSKKTAKKMAAYAACHDILNVNYPPEVYA